MPLALVAKGDYISGPYEPETIGEIVLARLPSLGHYTDSRLETHPQPVYLTWTFNMWATTHLEAIEVLSENEGQQISSLSSYLASLQFISTS